MKKPIFKENTIYSSKFDDIYYNPKQGIEESFYTFIKGCNLDLELKQKKYFNSRVGIWNRIKLYMSFKIHKRKQHNLKN